MLDLDGTLYPSSFGLEREIVPRIRSVAAEWLNVDWTTAVATIQDLNRRYGYCVRGLATEFGIDPAAFVERVYADIDRSAIHRNDRLRSALTGLADGGWQIVVATNSGTSHSHEVMERLGIESTVRFLHAIEDAGYFLKPDERFFASLEARTAGLTGSIYCDDSVRNLHIGWYFGMDCVLVDNQMAREPYFWENHLRIQHLPPDHFGSTRDLPAFLESLAEAK